ncbi:MAG: hypothetical protein J2O48_09485, partial [Solirubrobacterales bacterium]|nr:hypothetical protein [Solirubrobacterales bacterium]
MNSSNREISRISRRLAQHRRPQDLAMAALTARPQLRAALFRTVDVTPACDAPDELAAHLAAYLGREQLPASAGRITRRGVSLMAQRFIAGETVAAAGPKLESLWRRGIASSLDLLGEATVTRAEGAAYAQRCADALLTLSRAAAAWPPQPLLEHDSAGPLPRAQLSVKVTALTPLIKPLAPAR